MTTYILELETLTIGFKNSLFENISATIHPGTITALMGLNGIGKSCLLKTISRLVDVQAGSLKVLGKDINQYSDLEMAKVIAVVLTQKIHVDFMRVDELIYLGRSPYTNWLGDFQKMDHDIVSEVMKLVGIVELKNLLFSELSDGQKQKVLIARALAQKPTLLILDEPTTYLDIPSKIELINLLKKIAMNNNIAILMSTHDLDLIEKEVDQIWLMGNDKTFHKGSPESLRSSGLFFKYFYSSESLNLN
jgi:iron complex transport system ATP-binding protein